MPELPEVETVRRMLEPKIVGRTVTGVSVLWHRTLDRPTLFAFERSIIGRLVRAVERRGKYLVVSFDAGGFLLIHLRMSGDVVVSAGSAPAAKHLRAALHFDNGMELRFDDPRKFGRWYFVDHPDEVVGKLGPEPLGEQFTGDMLARLLQSKKGRIKPLLLDQRFIAGLGNIYVVESLWRAGIHPLRRANSLSAEEARRLHRAIRAVLGRAVERGGTDLGDGVWKTGVFNPSAYGRAGQRCRRCRTVIQRIVLGQRGTEFCITCQPRSPRAR